MLRTRLFDVNAFHPDLRSAARCLPRSVVNRRSLPLMRAMLKAIPDKGGAAVEQVSTTATVRVHRPKSVEGLAPGLVWMHGGGLLFGVAKQDDAICRLFADKLGVIVAAVDHRLAPEHPYPAAVEDCHAALTWLANQPDVDPSRIAVGGASAGGGLAAALALLARERGEVRPVFQLLVYPMLDDRTAASPDPRPAHRRLWNNKANYFGWSSYLGHAPGGVGTSPIAAPGRCEDFAGLPPAWIGVGTLDLFHEEDVAYAKKLNAAGVNCDVEVVEGGFHGFDALRRAQVSKEFINAQIDALGRGLDLEFTG